MRCQANPPSLPGPTSRRVTGAHRGTDQTRGLPGDGDLLRRRVSTLPIPPRHPPAPRLKRPDPTVRRHPCPGSSGVEQWIENPRVGGSIPPPGTIFIRCQEEKDDPAQWVRPWPDLLGRLCGRILLHFLLH